MDTPRRCAMVGANAMPPDSPASPRITARELLVVLIAGLFFWVSAWTASKDLPAVADEIAHITGGESYWRYGINHFQPENGYFAMHWSTLPLRWHPPVFPAMPPNLPQAPSMIVMGHRMFYESGNNAAALLSAGRAMMALLGVALVGLSWWWARQLWGRRGGLLTILLGATCPTLLAQSGLVMSDVTLSFFLLLTVTLWWQLLHGLSAGRLLGCGLSLGTVLLSKMSGVLVAPMLLILLIVRLCETEPLAWSWGKWRGAVRAVRRTALLGGVALAVPLVAAFVLWAAFGFHYSMYVNSAAPSPTPEFTWDALLREGGLVARVVGGLRGAHLLPEAWLQGLAQTTYHLAGRPAFLNGHTYTGGSLAYFPYAWLVKTPLALFCLMALGLGVAVGLGRTKPALAADRPRTPCRNLVLRSAPLLVLFVVYWAFALTTQINIGQRHLLPIYAPMLILAGGAAGLLTSASRAGRMLVVALVVWFVATSWWIRPHYLAYFNAIAGGPANGYHHLVDSNVDVGQDLIALQQWLDTSTATRGHPEPVFLSFFGPADPLAHGVHATRFADDGFDARPRSSPAQLQSGLYCISVTLFQGLYTLTPGPWTAERETLYWRLLGIVSTRPPTHAEGITFEHLQFARLRLSLADREPLARVGYSILVFRLSAAELAQALYAPWPGSAGSGFSETTH
ncbi:MAG: phospholipid carrier-dependent glycosyltransferase [Opitutaceae bacterium]